MSAKLETERLQLRKPRIDDASAAVAYLSDPEAMRFLGGVRPELDADPEFVVRRWLERWEANGFGKFVVVRRADGCFVGRVGAIVWDTRSWLTSTLGHAGEHAQPELGWVLAREHWGNGYAVEAARAAREWLRCEHGVDRLVSLIHPDNARSIRVAEKLGAVRERTVEIDSGPAVVWVHPR